MTLRTLIAGAIVCLAAPAAAAASGFTIEEVADVLRAEGIAVEVEAGAAPALYGDVAGGPFELYAYNCAGSPLRCDEFLFSSRFEANPAPSLAALNAFNQAMIAGRASLDGAGMAVLEHFFTVDAAAGPGLILQNLAIWESILADFEDFLAAPSS